MFSDLPWLAKWELHLIFLQEMEATVVDGNVAEAGHIIVTTISGKHGDPKQVYFWNFILRLGNIYI